MDNFVSQNIFELDLYEYLIYYLLLNQVINIFNHTFIRSRLNR